MKKLFFATALAIASLSALSASTLITNTEITGFVVVEEFKEIPIDQLPAAVTEALANAHTGAVINRAYVNEKEQYKLEVTAEDGSTGTLYADAEGNWLNLEE